MLLEIFYIYACTLLENISIYFIIKGNSWFLMVTSALAAFLIVVISLILETFFFLNLSSVFFCAGFLPQTPLHSSVSNLCKVCWEDTAGKNTLNCDLKKDYLRYCEILFICLHMVLAFEVMISSDYHIITWTPNNSGTEQLKIRVQKVLWRAAGVETLPAEWYLAIAHNYMQVSANVDNYWFKRCACTHIAGI